eukprot:m.204945 g.204945  ORF g.204945 m.204945 type:complete len:148 (+) comp26040_c0_seq6:100-543(+)
MPRLSLRAQSGCTALIWASQADCIEVVERLIAASANVNIQDKSGFTALVWASKRGYSRVVERLIIAAADVTILTKEGKTALDYALSEKHLDPKVVAMLKRPPLWSIASHLSLLPRLRYRRKIKFLVWCLHSRRVIFVLTQRESVACF